MEFNLDTIRKFFKDEDGKPNTKNVIIFMVILTLLIMVLRTATRTSTEDHNSQIAVNYDLPPEEEESSVRIGTNADLHYITRGEMEYVLAKKIEDLSQKQTEAITIAFETSQQNILSALQEESRYQQQYLLDKYEKRLAELERNLAQTQKSQRDYENLIKNTPTYTTAVPEIKDTPASQTPRTYGNIPVNDYSGRSNLNQTTTRNAYQSSYTTDMSNTHYSSPEYIPRYDSGFVVNNYRTSDPGFVINSGQIYQSKLMRTDGISSGNMYSGILVTGAVSSKESCPVVVRLTEDIVVKNQVLVPKNTNMLGYAVADYNTRQIYINLERLILADREIKIKASLVNKDGTPGFCSKYIDKTNEAFWKNFALNFVATLLQTYKDVTYYVSDQGLPVKTYDDTALNKGIDATTAGITSFADRILRDAQAMGAIILVNPDIEVKILVEENISLENLRG